MGEKNRHFSREFKRDAVQLVTEKGMPVGKVARELDIHPNLLHLWRRRFLAKGDKGCALQGRRMGKAEGEPWKKAQGTKRRSKAFAVSLARFSLS